MSSYFHMEQESDISPLSRTNALFAPRPRVDVHSLLRTFSPSERLLLYVLTLVMGVSAFVLLGNANKAISTEVPTQGGEIVEGAVGVPRFVNPLLAASQQDQDLTMLVFSGLLRAGNGGTYIPDLAESYSVSEDGTTYTFHLREGLTFHDGTPLTSQDVLFTVQHAQKPEIKSPRRADWEGVNAAAPDDRTVVFTLPHAYAPFRENVTLGILPKKLWESVPAEEFPFSTLNTHPVGSGPYRVMKIETDATGAPSEYELEAFKGFALGEPNIVRIIYRLFANTEELIAAFESNEIESLIVSSPKSLARDIQERTDFARATLARVFGVFLNQNHAPVLANAAVREALDTALDKEKIVADVLGGYGVSLDGPIPPGIVTEMTEAEPSTMDAAARTQAARDVLSAGGWKFDDATGSWTRDKATLSITLATADTEELVATTQAVADAWNAAGIKTEVQVFPLSEFNQTILRPRSYDAALFGEVVGRSLDLFAFWHSSQRNDPGLNLALYTSADADKALASARAETDATKRAAFLQEFLTVLAEDRPAIFLYAPQVAYIVPERLSGVSLGTLSSPSDRFASVHTWYRDTERVWNIFSR
jgi:peptide/nickel transport system substrate-binding protein